MKIFLHKQYKENSRIYLSELSSIGRAFDCSGFICLIPMVIKRSLVQFQQFGIIFYSLLR